MSLVHISTRDTCSILRENERFHIEVLRVKRFSVFYGHIFNVQVGINSERFDIASSDVIMNQLRVYRHANIFSTVASAETIMSRHISFSIRYNTVYRSI